MNTMAITTLVQIIKQSLQKNEMVFLNLLFNQQVKKNKDSIILGIESSCDDLCCCIKNGMLLSNIIANQSLNMAVLCQN